MAHESSVLLLEAAATVVGTGPEESNRRREPRDDGRTDAEHDQPLVRGGSGCRQCEYDQLLVGCEARSTVALMGVPSV